MENANPGNRVMNWMLCPPILVRFWRALTFPAVIMTRHELGERYWRSNSFVGQLLFCGFAFTPLPLFIRNGFGTFLAVLTNFVVVAWYVRCSRQVRREIKARDVARSQIHSFAMGVPRFGLQNNEQTNAQTVPTRMFLAGVVCLPISAAMGAYLGFTAMGLYAEASWRSRLAREAAMDARDASLGTSAFATAEAVNESVPQRRRAAGNPLEGFENVLAEAQSK